MLVPMRPMAAKASRYCRGNGSSSRSRLAPRGSSASSRTMAGRSSAVAVLNFTRLILAPLSGVACGRAGRRQFARAGRRGPFQGRQRFAQDVADALRSLGINGGGIEIEVEPRSVFAEDSPAGARFVEQSADGIGDNFAPDALHRDGRQRIGGGDVADQGVGLVADDDMARF